MSVDARSRTLAIALFAALLGASTCAFGQDSEHVFEPGKKHVCVPAASGEGWDCGTEEQPPATPTPREGPTLRSSRASDGTSASLADVAAIEPAAAAPARSEPAIDSPPPSRSVPSYLLAPPGGNSEESPTPAPSSAPAVNSNSSASAPASARDTTATATPPVASEPAPAPAAPVASAPVETAPAPVAPESTVAAPETQSISTTTQHTADAATAATAEKAAPGGASPPIADRATPAESPPPVVAAPATEAPAPASGVANPRFADLAQQRAAFAGLPGSAYVLDIAHGADRNAVAAAASIDLPVGQVWLLHLPRDGADWYVAVWGEFASVELAREARGEAASHGVAEVGWPRKVGPLQQELRLQH